MSKNKGKKTMSRKRVNSDNPSASSSKDSKHDAVPKKKKCVKNINEDGIAKSKKLIEKLRTNGKSSTRKATSRISNSEPRICGNGKPMPPLTELEAMFEDSDDDTPPPVLTTNTPPEQPDNLTIKNIAGKLIDFVSNFPECITLDVQEPPPPIIPPKKRKKPEVPYIVGCKDRPQVSQRPSVNFCKGDDYGIDKNTNNDDNDTPKKCAKRTKALNISKSIFNAKSDDIATRLKECDNDSIGSSDSDKTIEYEYSSTQSSWPRSFSPLPSTSKDNTTILQNDKRFNDSLMKEKKMSNDYENDVLIPCETIILDDDIEADTKPEAGKVSQSTNVEENDDYIEIIEPDLKSKKDESVDSAATVNIDYYNFDFTPNCEEITDVIDVDDVIAENQAIIEKYSQIEKINTVTHVDLTELNNPSTSNNINNISLITSDSISSTNNIVTSTNEVLNLPNNQNKQCELNMSTTKESGTYRAIREIITNFFSGQSSDKANDTNNPIHNYRQTTVNKSSAPLNECTHIIDDIIPTMPNQIQDLTCEYILPNAVSNYTNLHNRPTVATINCAQNTYHNPLINNRSNYLNRPCSTSDIDVIHITSTVSNVGRNRKSKKRKNKNNTLSTPILHSPVPQAPVESQTNGKPKGIGDCPICMDSLENNSVASTLCGHVFCMTCIKAAIKSSGKRCPTCRKVLKGVGYHQLFL
ncbi:uncharacterized protein ACR2FA_012206 [Aphomia sociella]